ncbi:MAG: LysR family transcriptional regulator [Acidimicrobiales bacterium]
MDWTARQLRAIVTIAERRNISHAAVELELTQPTVSRMLSRIEQDLGTPLFRRDARGASPTEAGVRFAAHAAEVLRTLDDATDEIRSFDGRLVGKICVAMPDTIGHTLFIPLIDRFAVQHPDVELRVMSSHPNGIPLVLMAGDADVGVVSSAHKHNGLIIRPLAEEQLHLVGAGPIASGRPRPMMRRTPRPPVVESITLDEVADYPLVLPAIQPGLRRIIDAAFAQRQLRPDVVLEVDAEDALVDLVGSGRAHSIMSFAGVQRFVAGGSLQARRIVDPPIQRLLSTALPEGRPTTRLMTAVEQAIHILAHELQDQAQWAPWSH